jgi:putative MATE family efflux protein
VQKRGDYMDAKERKQYDQLIRTPIAKIIPVLAIPTVISMMIGMIYNLVDAYFVGMLGTSAAAAIGILMSIQTVFQAVGFMCGHGSGSRISVLLGKGKKELADVYASTGFLASIVASSIITILAMMMISPLMVFLGSTKTILPYARIYGFYILLSGPALSASCVLNNIMRYEGKASLAMVGLVSGGVLNMIGDPIFMFGLKMGIHGAGLSTALSQYISFGILLYMFISKKTMTSISLKKAKGFGEELTRIMQNGTPSLIRQMLNSLSTMSLNIIAKPYGDAAIAGMTIVGRIVMFFASTMVGIGQAYQPVAAFNYGAKKYKRIREGFLVTWVLGETVLGIFAIIAFINPEPLILLFRNDPRVLAIGKNALRFHCIALIASPLSVVSNMMFQSIGESAIASFLAALRSGIYYIPILFILSRLLGILGIQSAQMVADILTTLTCIPFLVKFFRELPKKNMHVKMDDDYKHSS